MKTQIIGLLVLCLSASQTHALSCIQPNIARSFNTYQESSDVYHMALGKVSNLWVKSNTGKNQPQTAKAIFTGRFFGSSGLGPTKSRPITVKTTCVAHWCSTLTPPQNKGLVFLKQTSGGSILEVSVCPNGQYHTLSHQDISILKKCLQNGKCTAQQIRAMEGH